MDWLWIIALVIFLAIQAAGVAIAIHWIRKPGPFPRYPKPHNVFYLVQREDRAAYSRMMHRTMAVQMRDMSRTFDQFRRTIAKELMPPLQRLADAMSEAFGHR